MQEGLGQPCCVCVCSISVVDQRECNIFTTVMSQFVVVGIGTYLLSKKGNIERCCSMAHHLSAIQSLTLFILVLCFIFQMEVVVGEGEG